MEKVSQNRSFYLKNGFGSLVNNKCAMDAGLNMPVWLTVIMGLIGPALAMVPIIVGVANTSGSAAVPATNYSLDRNLAISIVDLNQSKTTLELKDHMLTYYKDGQASNQVGKIELTTYVNSLTNQYDVRTYFLVGSEEKSVNDLYKDIINEEFVLGTTNIKSDVDPSDTQYYKPTTIAFYKDGFGFSVYKTNTTTSGASFVGDFVNVPDGELISRIGTINNVLPTTYEEIKDQSYLNGMIKNFKQFLDESYVEIKNRSFLYTTTIYYAVYLGLVLLLGFLVFLLTRGKNNFNNYLKWYQCLAISAWLCITPGILSLGLGFVFSSYSVMMFILFMGIRTMWLSMKQLSPTYTQQ